MLVGPPGSGRSSQAELVCKKYQLVHVNTMIKNEISRTREGKLLWEAMKAGQEFPDSYICKVMEERLGKLDC